GVWARGRGGRWEKAGGEAWVNAGPTSWLSWASAVVPSATSKPTDRHVRARRVMGRQWRAVICRTVSGDGGAGKTPLTNLTDERFRGRIASHLLRQSRV